jgi:hypothetical protein
LSVRKPCRAFRKQLGYRLQVNLVMWLTSPDSRPKVLLADLGALVRVLQNGIITR